MTQLSRRSFLGGALVVIGAAALPAPLLAMERPVIWGDGVHDDTAGFRAALAGESFMCAQSGMAIVSGGRIFVSGGTFRFTDTLDLREAKVSSSIVRAQLDFRNMPRDRECAIDARDGPGDARHYVADCYIEGNGHGTGILTTRGSVISGVVSGSD